MEFDMGGAFLELVPFIIGGGIVPVHAILVLMLLRGAGGLLGAISFVSGAMLVRLTQGVVFGLIFGSAASEGADERSGTIKAALLVVLGVLLLVTAVKKILKEEDPDAPPPGWLTTVSSAGPLKALGFGMMSIVIAAKQWVFTLGAIGVIRDAGIERNEGITLFLVFTMLASLLLIVPIVFRIVAPKRSTAVLNSAGTWLGTHNGTIVIVVSTVFGIFFMFRGITALTG
jgi:uncharacterized membrane protein (UPF0136 family)